MGDVADASYVTPYPQDIVSGVSETKPPEEENEEVEGESVIVPDNAENGDENLGRNVDVTV